MRRSELLRLIIAEALLVAVFASLMGSFLGWLLAQAALLAVGETVGNLFSLVDLASGGFTVQEFIVAFSSGIAVAVLAALHPAWEAIHVSPLENALKAAWRPGYSGKKSWANRLGFLCLCVSPSLLFLAPSLPGSIEPFSVGVVGMLIFLLSLAFFCPALIVYAVKWFWRSSLQLPGVSWVEARLASDNLRRNPVALRHHHCHHGDQPGGDFYHRGLRQQRPRFAPCLGGSDGHGGSHRQLGR